MELESNDEKIKNLIVESTKIYNETMENQKIMSNKLENLYSNFQQKYDELMKVKNDYDDIVNGKNFIQSDRQKKGIINKTFEKIIELSENITISSLQIENEKKIEEERQEQQIEKDKKLQASWKVPTEGVNINNLEFDYTTSGDDTYFIDTSEYTDTSGDSDLDPVEGDELSHLLDDTINFIDARIPLSNGTTRMMNNAEFMKWIDQHKRGSKIPMYKNRALRPREAGVASGLKVNEYGQRTPTEDIYSSQDSSSEYYYEEDSDDDIEDIPQERPQLNLEIYNMMLGNLLDKNTEYERYKYLIEKFDREQRDLAVLFKTIGKPEFDNEFDRITFVQIMQNLIEEGRETTTPQFRNGKISKAFLQEKAEKASKIQLNKKEEMCIIFLLMYADTIHDARRLTDHDFRDKFISMIQHNATKLVQNMFPNKKNDAHIINLLYIINSNDSKYDDEILDLFIRLNIKNPIQTPLQKSIYNNGEKFYDNASNAVSAIDRVCTFQTLKDGGSKNDGNLWLFNPHNLHIFWEENGEYFGVQLIQKVIETEEDGVKIFALDNITSINYKVPRGGRGNKITYNRNFERLPLCTNDGKFGEVFMDIQLKKQAKAGWKMLLSIATDKSDGFSILPSTIFKYLGDFGMSVDEVFGITRVNGGRLPYKIEKSDRKKPLSKVENDRRRQYNENVKKYNKNPTEELRRTLSEIDVIESKISGIGNDRLAQVISKQLAEYTLESNRSRGYINPHFKSILVCSGEIVTKLDNQKIVSYGAKPTYTNPSYNSLPLAKGEPNLGYVSDTSYATKDSCATGAPKFSILSNYYHTNRKTIPITQSLITNQRPLDGPAYTFALLNGPQPNKKRPLNNRDDGYISDVSDVSNVSPGKKRPNNRFEVLHDESGDDADESENESQDEDLGGGKKRKTRRIIKKRKFKKTRNAKKNKRNKTIKKQRRNKKRKTRK